jgi:hypothetical protein
VNCRIRLETTIASVRVALRAGLTVAIDVHIGGPEHGSAQPQIGMLGRASSSVRSSPVEI